MKALAGLRPNERRLAIVTAVVVGCWLLVSLLVQPLWDRGRELRVQVQTQQEKLEAVSRLLSQAPSVERRYDSLAGYLESEETEQTQRSFLNDLEALSRTADLQLNLKPRGSKREDRVSRFEVELDVEGSQTSLMNFLDALLAMPKLISIERVRLSIVPTKERMLRANLVIQKITLR